MNQEEEMKVCVRCGVERSLRKKFDIDACEEKKKDVCTECEYEDYLQRREEILSGKFKIKTMGDYILPSQKTDF